MRASLVFLTRIPVGGFPYAPADWRWASAHFPFAGLIVGLIMAAAHRATIAAGPFVAATIAISVGMLVTGAFHEDGLADTADALGGAYDRGKLFEILKDSRIGSFGAAALFAVLLLRIALLARLGAHAGLAIVVVSAAARTPPIWLMAAMPYVSLDETSKSKVVTRGGVAQAIVATGWGFAPLAIAIASSRLPLRTLGPAALAAIVTPIVCGWRFHVRAGGITGDFLGATEQVAECTIMLALVLALA
jgi:adenosylcobinamide-GDP ribazoletransferase